MAGTNIRRVIWLVLCLEKRVLVAAFNQEKALVGAFSVIVQPVVDRFTALVTVALFLQFRDVQHHDIVFA